MILRNNLQLAGAGEGDVLWEEKENKKNERKKIYIRILISLLKSLTESVKIRKMIYFYKRSKLINFLCKWANFKVQFFNINRSSKNPKKVARTWVVQKSARAQRYQTH